MSRPQIDYLQSQTLPWQASPWAHLAGCQVKGLSRDAASGARSLLVRYPIHWRGPRGALSIDEEALVLEGALDRDGRRYAQDCYGWSPAGANREIQAGPSGAVALVFWGAEPLWSTDGAAPAGRRAANDRPLAATFRDGFDMAWRDLPADAAWVGSGAQSKMLRGSLAGPSATLLLSFPPHLHPDRWTAPQDVLECAEELFVLSGDLLSPAGQMGAGAYCWHPCGSSRGPVGSRGGALALSRTCGGPYRRGPTSHNVTLEREPTYQPVVPPDLARLAAHPWRPQSY